MRTSSNRMVFLTKHGPDQASTRFRVIKLIPYLENLGIEARAFPDIRAGKRHLLQWGRLCWSLLGTRARARLLVFQKNLSPNVAALGRRFGARVVLDVDDSRTHRIDGSPRSEQAVEMLGSQLAGLDAVIVSTDALAEWAREWNRRVYVIPTCLDTERYATLERPSRTPPVVGWIGRRDGWLSPIGPALTQLADRTRFRLLVVGSGEPNGLPPDLPMTFVRWRLDLEPRVFADMDIGIMPLPDTERTRGKAGFKLLQYMAAGLPVVASPIGVNRELVRDGWNGFLAEDIDSWRRHLSTLIGDPELRARMGEAGQQFVRERYDLTTAASLWARACDDLFPDRRRP